MQDSKQVPEDAVAADGQTATEVVEAPEADVEARLAKAESEAREHYELFLRAKAEADNVRKRVEAEAANAQKYALERFATDLLAVRDSLEAALAVENTNVENLMEGVALTLKQLSGVFERHKVAEIHPETGTKFDPNCHQAVGMVDADAPANTVASVLQKGYFLEDRVIRPAMVMVAKPKAD